MKLYGGIEAGGTKFNCIVASGPEDIRAEARIPTTTPQETIGRVIEFFKEYQKTSGEKLAAVGVACFGPVDLHTGSPTWGYITTTPKPYWADTNVAGPISEALQVPVAFDMDINGAGMGELVWGRGQGLNNFIYITVGTGIGGGVIIDGRPVHGLVHPEIGHIRIPHDWQEDPYAGYCKYHGDCFEGLCMGPAMKDRWGQPAETLALDHPGWALEAKYIGLACSNLVCTLSPQRIILGGGVMQQMHLFPMIRETMVKSLNGYVRSPAILDDIDNFITSPGLGTRSGMLGAVVMARDIED
jgi:fructokinase